MINKKLFMLQLVLLGGALTCKPGNGNNENEILDNVKSSNPPLNNPPKKDTQEQQTPEEEQDLEGE